MSTIDPPGRLLIPMLPSPAARLPLRPIPGTYEPGYPAALTREEIQELLRPGLFHRFSRPTLLAGAVFAGALVAAGCGAAPAADVPAPAPSGGASRAARPRQSAAVDKLVAEILGAYDKNKFWNKSARPSPAKELSGNPPVKYPQIPISFGNSFIGVIDVAAARDATIRLFEAYGLELVPDVPIQGEGYAFVADGFDSMNKVGFKIIRPPEDEGEGEGQGAPEHALSPDEIKPLDAAVKEGGIRMFVVKAEGFPNMDGDMYTPMEYYLASVIDYLNWIHGDREIAR
jgi:hypothetical protein